MEVARAGLARGLLARRELGIVGGREHGLQVERSLLAALLERGHAPERGRRRAGSNARAVLRDPLEAQQALLHERGEDVGHELVERLAVTAAELRQTLVAHALAARDPLEGAVGADATGDLARAAHAHRDRVEPQRQEHARAEDRASGVPVDGLRILGERRQVEAPEQLPEHARRVLRRQGVLRHLEAHHTLLTNRLFEANARHGVVYVRARSIVSIGDATFAVAVTIV